MLDETALGWTECSREGEEFTTIARRRLYVYDEPDLFRPCSRSAERQFGTGATESPARVHPRAAGNGRTYRGMSMYRVEIVYETHSISVDN